MSRDLTQTFSIAARDTDTGELGSACASRVVAVGARVPCMRYGVGAVNTQHCDDLRIAEAALDEMARGAAPQEAIEAALARHEQPELRQLVAIDVRGRSGAWTGAECQSPCRHVIGEHCVAAGNTLIGEAAIDAMVAAFDAAAGESLAHRLLLALEAGEAAGGDNRGKQSAALKVIPAELARVGCPHMDFRVDEHAEPLVELRRLYELLA